MLIILEGQKTNKLNNKLKKDLEDKNYEVYNLSSIDKVKELSKLINTSNDKLIQEVNSIWDSYNRAIANDIFRYIEEYDRGSTAFIINVSDKDGTNLIKEVCPNKYKNNIIIYDDTSID